MSREPKCSRHFSLSKICLASTAPIHLPPIQYKNDQHANESLRSARVLHVKSTFVISPASGFLPAKILAEKILAALLTPSVRQVSVRASLKWTESTSAST